MRFLGMTRLHLKLPKLSIYIRPIVPAEIVPCERGFFKQERFAPQRLRLPSYFFPFRYLRICYRTFYTHFLSLHKEANWFSEFYFQAYIFPTSHTM